MIIPRKSTSKPRKSARKSRVRKVNKDFKQKVLAIVAQKEEVKYVGFAPQTALAVDTFIDVTTDLVSALPPLTEGTGSFQRVGQHISNVRGKTHFSFSIPYNYTGTSNWVVRVYMLASKQIKSFTNISSIQANTLLDLGNGTTQDWPISTVLQNSQLPISRENFTGHFKDFKLSKNSGSLNGDSSTPPPSANGGHYASNHQFTWNWSHKGKVMYDELLPYPTNYNPMFILVAFPYDGYPVTKEPSPIQATIRNEMYYQDA